MKTAIIIGGGIAGCSTAHALASRGIAVTLIERESKLANAASGNPVGILYPKLSASPCLADEIILQGFDFSRQLLMQSGHTKLYGFCGMLQLADTPQDALKKEAQLHHHPKRMHAVNAEQASAIAGVLVAKGGLYWPESGWLRPRLWCELLSLHPLIQTILDETALTINPHQGKWCISSAKSEYEADSVVICNAADLARFPQCKDIPIISVRGQINIAEENPMSSVLKTVICSDHFIAPAVDGLHSFGTSYAPNRQEVNLCEADTHDNLRAIRRLSAPIYESFMNYTHFDGRVAWRTATRDYLPLAGMLLDTATLRKYPPRYNANPATLPWLNGLYINAGHGSKGMITAPLCGDYIARLINTETSLLSPPLASRLNPSRFALRELGLKQLAQTLFE